MNESLIAIFGGVIVFLAGVGFSFWMLDQYNKTSYPNPALSSNSQPTQGANPLSASKIIWLSLIGGGFSFAIYIVLMFGLPRERSLWILLGLITLELLLCLIWFLANRPPTGGKIKPKKSPPTIEELMNHRAFRVFLARVGHDKEKASRLIEYERKRTPNASINQLCENAIFHLEHDNG